MIYATAVLRQLGYGCTVISDRLNCPVSLIQGVVSALGGVELGAFDVVVEILRGEVVSIEKFGRVCVVPRHVARNIVRRGSLYAGFLEGLQRLEEGMETGKRRNAAWLYVRGLSLTTISAITNIKTKVLSRCVGNCIV